MKTIDRPRPGDYPAYHGAYLLAAKGDDLASAFHHASEQARETLGMVPTDRLEYRYAPGKWTIKEVYQHIIDTERVFSYRALCIARQEKVDLPGMDEDAYQAEARTSQRAMGDIMREHDAVRNATIELFESFDNQAIAQKGMANGKVVTVPALGWIIAGHAEHHLRIIRERYLG